MHSSFYCSKQFFSLALLCIALAVGFTGCRKKKGKTAEQKAIDMLNGTWVLGTVEKDKALVTDDFTGFTLIMDGNKTFTATPDTKVFPTGTAWDFEGQVTHEGAPFSINMEGVVMEVKVLTDTNLTLAYTYSQPGGRTGRIANLSGAYVFNLVKQ